jgi:polar amino acid transport system substrate-binding protein
MQDDQDRGPDGFPALRLCRRRHGARGLDIDVATRVAAKLGATVELIPVTTANQIPYLPTKKVDLVISTLGNNPERERVIDVTVARSPCFIALFAPKAAAIKAPEGRAGQSIAVTPGSVEQTGTTGPDFEAERDDDRGSSVESRASHRGRKLEVESQQTSRSSGQRRATADEDGHYCFAVAL